ncbi:MAG: apolipoprotein N-acyltransferase [Bryobacteraceae bacterium]
MNLLLSLLTGVLLVLVFPRFDIAWLAPVALAPLLVASAGESNWKRRFCNGWASGFVFWFFICIWIQFVLEVHGGMGRWGGWGTFVLFAILKALHTGLFAALAGGLMRTRWAVLTIAALWCAIEHAHGTWGLAWLGLGFAWLDLGNAGVDWPVLMRLAPITGVHGLSFVLAMTGCGVALVVLRRPWRELAPLAILPLLLLLPSGPARVNGTQSAQVVQPDVDTEARWTEESFADFEKRLSDLSLDEPAPLIVWPEAPAPFYPDRPAFRSYISGIAKSAHASFLMGGVAYAKDGAPLNSAFLLNPSGELVERYDKIQLVPFGEYIPPAFNWVNRITGEAGDFQPGTRIVTLPVDGHKLGAFICYESAFPNLVRQFTLQGSEMLVNLSNDGYFGDSAAREQHLSLVRMRAAENQRWILRATNDGITAMIDPAGRVTDTIPSHKQTSEVMRFNFAADITPYTRYGDWFPWTCLVAAIAMLLYWRKPGTTA